MTGNPTHNAFYGDYLYVKLIGFLTIGTSVYATKALNEYNHAIEQEKVKSKKLRSGTETSQSNADST